MFKYFKLSEFDCPCCGGNRMRLATIALADEARHLSTYPWKITSGYRCMKHNDAKGGDENSAHLDGHAMDVACENSAMRYLIIESAIQVGFRRIGVYSKHIHLDTANEKGSPVIWYGTY